MLLDYLKTKYREMLDEGWAAYEMGNLRKAEEHFSQIIANEDDPDNTDATILEAHAALGIMNLRHRDLFEANRWLQECMYIIERRYPEGMPKTLDWKRLDDRAVMRALIGLGHLSYEKHDLDRARSYYETLVKADKRDELGMRRYLDAIEQGIPFADLDFF